MELIYTLKKDKIFDLMEEFEGFEIYAGASLEELQKTKTKELSVEISKVDTRKWRNHALFGSMKTKKNEERLKKIKVGDKIKVFWEEENEFFAGTVTKIKGKSYHIDYDDGDQRIETLSNVDFELCSEKEKRKNYKKKIFYTPEEFFVKSNMHLKKKTILEYVLKKRKYRGTPPNIVKLWRNRKRKHPKYYDGLGWDLVAIEIENFIRKRKKEELLHAKWFLLFKKEKKIWDEKFSTYKIQQL